METYRPLQQDVSAEFNQEPSVHAARIGLEVKDGVATLAGHVDSHAQKCNAERAAQRASGVLCPTWSASKEPVDPTDVICTRVEFQFFHQQSCPPRLQDLDATTKSPCPSGEKVGSGPFHWRLSHQANTRVRTTGELRRRRQRTPE